MLISYFCDISDVDFLFLGLSSYFKYGGGIVSSYWSESSGSCTTHYHDTFNDINGDGQRNAGEPGSICSETICDQDCIDG